MAATLTPPVAGGQVIGRPYEGTHAKAFNVAGGSDNWESENAVDIGVPIGTPVYAVEPGTIGPQFGSLGSGGRFAGLRLHLNAADGSFYYAHLSSYAPGVRPGRTVKAGELLGYSGSANGVAHLHFASTVGIDPLAFVKDLPGKVADTIAGTVDPATSSSAGDLNAAGCATICALVLAGAAVGGLAAMLAGWLL